MNLSIVLLRQIYGYKCKYYYSILFPGSRRLSVGALMGLQIHKDDGEVIKKTKAAIASSYGSTPGVTQGGVTKIRNKTIPIINPMVKSSNWPQSNYKKGKFFEKIVLDKGQLKSEWILWCINFPK